MTGRPSSSDKIDFNHLNLLNQSATELRQEPTQSHYPILQNYQQIQGFGRPQNASNVGQRPKEKTHVVESPSQIVKSSNPALSDRRAVRDHQQLKLDLHKTRIATMDLKEDSKDIREAFELTVQRATTPDRKPPRLPVSQTYQKISSVSVQPTADLPIEPNYGSNGSGHLFKRRKLAQNPSLVTRAPNELRDSLFTDGPLRSSPISLFKSPTIKDFPGQIFDATKSPLAKKFPSNQVHSLLIFPTRPHIHRRNISPRADTLAIERAAVKHVVKVEPYRPDPPPSAPQYHRGGTADFFPWTGNHPEDVVNELTTKQGSCEKPSATSANSSARPTLWTSLRHRSGLQILSTLFVSTLQQRQSLGTITANCTFKPPPRVTLTETRREAWLKDFADLNIPLRRLSRRIPHGIIGKVLLDQCLTKNIPITRAIWLAKCVGANEIRSIKRKGTSGPFAFGGETRWIRDWTKSVEGFLESMVGECGALKWRDRMAYSLRLVSHLFSEQLLDQDQLLDWMIASLQASEVHTIAVWLLIVQAFWKEILRCWDRARCLAQALMEQLWKVYPPPIRDACTEVSQKLIQILRSFILSDPLCFLLSSWKKYEAMLKDCLELASGQLERLSKRNSRLRKPPPDPGHQLCSKSCQQKLITFLDSLPIRVRIDHVADVCRRTVADDSLLIRTCLDWATNIYRDGHARIYIVVRLLRRWASEDIGLDGPIQEFMCMNQSIPQQQKSNFFRIVADLVHSKDFLISHYMGWLNAKGIMIGLKGKPTNSIPFEVQLLLELPEYKVPHYVVNLRRTLLSRIGASSAKENGALAATKATVALQIRDFFPPSDVPSLSAALQTYDLGQLSRTIKSSVGRWILHTAVARVQALPLEDGWHSGTNLPLRNSDPALSLEQFQSVRKILVSFEDFPVLADIISVCCKNSDVKVLTAASDIINHHIDVFMAIGAVNGLFKSLYQRYEEYVSQKTFEPLFVESLIDLGAHLPGSSEEVKRLRKALIYHERVLSAAACSPVSEHMAETLHFGAPAFLEEVEQVLSSGTSMDKQTFKKLFGAITKQMEASWGDPMQLHMFKFAEVLLRLRNYGANRFTESLHYWLDGLLPLTQRPTLLRVLLPFICSAAIKLEVILEKLVSLLAASASGNGCGLDGLELLIITDLDIPPFSRYKKYRLHHQQVQIIKESSNLTVPLLRATVATCSSDQTAICERARALMKNPRIKTVIKGLLQQYAISPDALSQAFGVRPLHRTVVQVIDDMLYSPSSPSDPNLNEVEPQTHFSNLFSLINHFNIPLCQLKLRLVLSTSQVHVPNSIVNNILEKLANPPRASPSHKPRSLGAFPDIWASLLADLEPDQASLIFERAEMELFALMSASPLAQASGEELEALLAIIQACSDGLQDHSGFPQLIVQTTCIFERILNDQEAMANGASITDGASLCITILLRLLSIHVPGNNVKSSVEDQAPFTSLLIRLSLLLIHPSLLHHPDLCEHILDTLTLLLSDGPLPENIRSELVHHLRHDPRLRFLFGFPQQSDITEGWLQVVSGENGGERRNFEIRRWEMMGDVTPVPAENDSCISLTLFGARKSVL